MGIKSDRWTLRLVLFAAAFLPHAAFAQAAEAAGAGGKLLVNGVLISDRGRSALVNGHLVREQERVADALVVEISEHDVRLRRGGYDLTILVGGSASWEHASPIQQRAAAASPPAPGTNDSGSEQRHKVTNGETLSGIAERHVPPGGTLVGTMRAIFEANPQAFFGDMHSLRAGVTLYLPAATTAIPDTQVAKQLSDNALNPGVYGPVRDGESLSVIASRFADANATIHQVMAALFEKNPHAFGDNINLLYSGATLRLPDPDEIASYTPAAAAAKIAQHMIAWNERRAPPLQAALAPGPNASLP